MEGGGVEGVGGGVVGVVGRVEVVWWRCVCERFGSGWYSLEIGMVDWRGW